MCESLDSTSEQEALVRAQRAIADLQARLEAAERSNHEPIAVVGMNCRLPGTAVDVAGYWSLLSEGRSSVTDIPADRWNVDALYDPNPETPRRMYTRKGSFLREMDRFDPAFFEISPREAQTLDPQQRLLLEVAWAALEDAGENPQGLRGSATGVFVGMCSGTEYSDRVRTKAADADLYSGTGNASSVAAGRVSYYFGFHGPALAVDTACSSSLLAVHLAMQSLRRGECGLALAGGVNAILSPVTMMVLCRGRMLSAIGRCSTFDAAADGYVRGEGCGLVVLKRLSDAVRDHNRILAVLRGSAVNQDGRSGGLTAPNGAAQEALIRSALADASLTPDQISYVEAHGTGTRIGDPIEVHALQAVFGDRPSSDPLLVGSVKTNIGHLEAAAGVAALMKVILAYEHELIPAHLHLTEPNPAINWSAAPLEVATRPLSWPRGERPRRAGVSAFAFNGTNVHLVVEEPPADTPSHEPSRPGYLLTLSARTEGALRTAANNLASHISTHPMPLRDVSFTLNDGRARFEHRAAFVATSLANAEGRLRAFSEYDNATVGYGTATGAPRVAFLYTGQGSQYPGMGRELYESQPVFRGALEECDAVLGSIDGVRLLDVLYQPESDADERLRNTGFAQPAIFSLQFALTTLWRSWGVGPGAVAGHSVGEIAAACAAGVFTLPDALSLVAARARLMRALPTNGGMRTVSVPESAAAELIRASGAEVWVAAVNAVDETVVGGTLAELERFDRHCRQQAIATTLLHVSHAFHTPLMSPMLEEFRRVVSTLAVHEPRIPLVSNITGRALTSAERMDADYWCRHVLAPVQFVASVQALQAAGYETFLEIGPQPVLSGLGQRSASGERCAWVPSLRRGRADWVQMQEAVGQLFVRGVDFDGRALSVPERPRRTSLPTYPFERRRLWVDAFQDEAEINGPRESGPRATGLAAVRSALSGDLLTQSVVHPDTDVIAADHLVFESPVYPAAGFASQIVHLAAHAASGAAIEMSDFTVTRPLVFAEERARLLQTTAAARGDGDREFACTVFSADIQDPLAPNWTSHASATVRVVDAVSTHLDVPQLSDEGTSEATGPLYADFVRRGVAHGPAYRLVETIQKGNGLACARVAAPSGVDPACGLAIRIDAAIQVLAGALNSVFHGSDDAVFLPVRIGRLSVHSAPALVGTWRVVARASADYLDDSSETNGGDVWCFDDAGRLVMAIEGYLGKRASREALRRLMPDEVEQWLHEIVWRVDTAEHASIGPGESWVLLSGTAGVANELTKHLRQAGAFVATQGTSAYVSPDQPEQDAATAETFSLALSAAERDGGVPVRGVAYLASLEPGEALSPALHAERLVGEALALAHALLAMSPADRPRLLIATRGVFDVVGPWISTLESSALVGFWRAVRQEHPELSVRLVDVDPGDDVAAAAGAIWSELTLGDDESEVARRQGQRWVPRVARLTGGDGGRPAGAAYALEMGERGLLDRLAVVPSTDPIPGPDEVRVDLTVSALNFRDVLNALGVLPGDAVPLGSEFVGRVTAIGSRVTTLTPGDVVMGLGGQAFRSAVCTPAALVARVPAGLTHEAAATIPTAYLTAWYALSRVAKLRVGERVLIHAAAGGVGLAAVHVARLLGAEVFGTAGSDAKRAYLRGLGVDHLWDSRSPTFAESVIASTGGRGVDVVLNSLTGDFIPASLAALAPGGRFVEIGKTDLWTPDRVAAVRSDVSYEIFDLGQPVQERPDEVGRVLVDLLSHVAAGALPPLPRRVFPLPQAQDAFRFMAQARHVGKVVIRHPVPPAAPRADGSYLVTGGLGAVGLALAEGLASSGAGHLVLVSRSAPNEDAEAAIARLRATGTTIQVASADVGDLDAVERVLSAIPQDRPLRGVIHAAGALDDGLVKQMTPARVDHVFAGKVRGAWHLHKLTLRHPLDFFVLCSSTAAVFGSAGQSNYAAANAWLDALAQWRVRAGHPGLSVNWGAWADVGMATRVSAAQRARWSVQGFRLIPPARGFSALTAALDQGRPQVVVQPVDWSALGRALEYSRVPPILADVIRRTPSRKRPAANGVATDSLLAELNAAAPADREGLLRAHLRSQIEVVLCLEPSEGPGDDQALTELGMDSLMAIELSNRLEMSLGVSLPTTVAFEYPTIATMSGYLAKTLRLVDGERTDDARASAAADEVLAESAATMTEEELDNILSGLAQDEPGSGNAVAASNPRRGESS
jgi:acyl transferase domain-containing protein/NADPH:quinone reductase-like Zn-dependent oxidoreductase/NAD(P)-dependent dehydrogenase (short-subunit alcohol dehydrogenase family)/acyl carrier protein